MRARVIGGESLAELLGGQGGGEEDERPETPTDVMALNLLEYHDRIVRGNPFRPRDLVQLRPGTPYHNKPGRPQVVLEVFDPPLVEFDPTSPGPYVRNDLLVMLEERGHYITHVMPSWAYEPYTGSVADVSVPSGD